MQGQKVLCLITVSAIRVFHWFAEEAGVQCKGLFLKRAKVCEHKTQSVKVKRNCMRSQKGMCSGDANLCCGGDTRELYKGFSFITKT